MELNQHKIIIVGEGLEFQRVMHLSVFPLVLQFLGWMIVAWAEFRVELNCMHFLIC